jgi:hypothetical protein
MRQQPWRQRIPVRPPGTQAMQRNALWRQQRGASARELVLHVLNDKRRLKNGFAVVKHARHRAGGADALLVPGGRVLAQVHVNVRELQGARSGGGEQWAVRQGACVAPWLR